jgi:hypothetical protein
MKAGNLSWENCYFFFSLVNLRFFFEIYQIKAISQEAEQGFLTRNSKGLFVGQGESQPENPRSKKPILTKSGGT